MRLKKIFDFHLLRRVFTYAKPYRKQFLVSVGLAVLLAAIAPVRPWLIQLTVDKYISNQLVRMLVIITGVQIIVLLVESGMRFYFTYLTNWLGQTVIKDLRMDVYNKIINLNLRFFDHTPIGTLTTRTVNDIEAINDIFSQGIISIIADLLMIFSIIGIMLFTDWRLTLISLAAFPILIIATYLFKESVNKSFHRVRNAVAHLNAFVQEHLTGIAVLQAFAVEDREYSRFQRINRDYRKANVEAIFAYSVFFPVVEIISAISLGLLVWYGAVEVLNADLRFGVIIAFMMYINMLFRPLRTLADKFNVLQMGMVASERVFKVMDNQDYINDKGAHKPKIIDGNITFDHVWFAYKDEQYVLKNINFSANKGEILAIVGNTGSGKTTIISILNRLYDVSKGSINIDDTNIRDYQLNTLRRKIGVVLQDVFLFSGSILENITLRDPDVSRQQVEKAARMINLHDFIMELPGGYDYNVRERGSTLSLGQRQLISFIRVLLYDPSILVLDEATSSVDTESEILIQQATEKLIAGRTAIVIAHRLSTIRKASNIIVLDKGEIKEMGNHEELLKKEGFYYRLHQMQFNNEKEAVS